MKLRYLAPVAALGLIVAPAAAMATKAPKTHAAKVKPAKTKKSANSHENTVPKAK
jgi:hypothetical protein